MLEREKIDKIQQSLQLREADGKFTIIGEQRTAIINELVSLLTTTNFDLRDKIERLISSLQMTETSGMGYINIVPGVVVFIISGTNRTTLINELVKVLTEQATSPTV